MISYENIKIKVEYIIYDVSHIYFKNFTSLKKYFRIEIKTKNL